jgi:DNA-binding MurR/RpiR family transcriptional regulator
MSAFVKIKSIKSSLSTSETKLADFILESSNVIRTLSSLELSKVIGVSQSSVIKFSQKLGYKGYPAFKLALIDTSNNEFFATKIHGEITLNDSLEMISSKMLNSKRSVLNETINLNEQCFFEQAIKMIKSAKRMVICGLGGSALVGKDFSYKLQKLGIAAIADSNVHSQLAYVTSFTSHDLVFAISESGSTHEVIKITEQAKKNNCKVISLTRYGKNAVSENADLRLYSVAEIESIRLSSILSRTSQEFIIDILFVAITQSSRQERKILEKTIEVIKEFRRN